MTLFKTLAPPAVAKGIESSVASRTAACGFARLIGSAFAGAVGAAMVAAQRRQAP